jgi:hypothetical protein
VKRELQIHLLPLLGIFILTSVIWFFAKVPYYQFIFLFVGLGVGAFLIDIDHLIFWLILKPNIEESKLARVAIDKHDFISVIKLINSTRHSHTSLIFHHFFFQVVLALVSVFVFTSSGNVVGMSTLLAINIHLIVDEINDYQDNRSHLQNWLFARESKQIPLRYLKHYLTVFTVFTLIFILLLIRSQT